MVLNSNLVLLNQEHYGDKNYDVFHATTILHNSQVAVAGIHTANESQETNMWILKLNSDASAVKLPTNHRNFYEKLCKLFEDEISYKQLRIDEDLTITIYDKNLLFQVGEFQLNTKQKIFLKKIVNKLIPFLYENKDKITTFEIDGHTSKEWAGTSFTQRYLNNEKLSLNRSYETLRYIFLSQDIKQQKWLIEVLKGSGLSYSKKMSSKEKSRRISFKINLQP